MALMGGSLSTRRRLAAVLGGGFCGTLTRYGFSTLLQGWLGKGWPSDILLINLTGAFLLAALTALADATFLIGPTRRLFLNVGFLGAYTTFSSLALGDVLLFTGGKWLAALLYLILSFIGGIGAVMIGDWLGHQLVKRARYSGEHAKATRKLTATLTVRHAEEKVISERSQGEEEEVFPSQREGEQKKARKRRL
jgi:fluoride exporter